MGLKDALRLKSFEVLKFEIRATKTKEGKLYLDIVNENLYQIRGPVASEGQGGSGSVSSEQIVSVSPIRSASVMAGDKRKTLKSSGAITTGWFCWEGSSIWERTPIC
ncbi:hypothetical protein Hanom_Chr05g00442111 [Helianthus anomalus]